MLRAVIIGWAQPRRSHLLRRRWMRRLLFRSFRRMMVFTRNPFVHPVLEKADTPINTGKTEGFRVFHEFLPANARNFACLGTRVPVRGGPAMPSGGDQPGVKQGVSPEFTPCRCLVQVVSPLPNRLRTAEFCQAR